MSEKQLLNQQSNWPLVNGAAESGNFGLDVCYINHFIGLLKTFPFIVIILRYRAHKSVPSSPQPLHPSCHTVQPAFIVFHTHSIARERAYYGVHGAVIAYFSKLFFIAHLLGAIAANGHDDWHFPPPLPGVSIHTLSQSWSHSCSCSCSPAMPIKFKSAGLLFLVRV